jgi:hypothetical protein
MQAPDEGRYDQAINTQPDTPKKDVIFLLDASGSMREMGTEPLEALNGFIASQAELRIPDSTFSLWYFNHVTKRIIDDQPLDSVGEITEYSPGGMTALFDAIGDAVTAKLEKDPVSDVVCVILTDGAENASKRYTSACVRKLVKTAEEKHNWKFVFLGANQDAFAAGATVGIHRCAEFECAEGDLEGMVRTSSQAIGRFRSDATVNDIHVDSSPAAKEARTRKNASAPVHGLTRAPSRS